MPGSTSRSQSGHSVSSFSSAPSRESVVSRLDDGSSNELLQWGEGMVVGVFGVLFTIVKERYNTGVRFLLVKLVLDFCQLFTLVFKPSDGWIINKDLWLWKVLQVLQFEDFIRPRGYMIFLVALYVMVALLAVAVALAVWVAWCFQHRNFPLVWPIKLLRVYANIFFHVLDVATLTLLQLPFDCRWLGYPPEFYNTLSVFPSVVCTQLPHVAHMLAAGVSLAAYLAMAMLNLMADFELNPTTRNLYATANSVVEVKAFCVKFLMTVFSYGIGWTKIVVIGQFIFSSYLTWLYLIWQPHLFDWVTHVRVGLNASIAVTSLGAVILAFNKQASLDFRKLITTTFLAMIGPAVVVGALVSYVRLTWWVKYVLMRYRTAPAGQKARRIYKFKDPHEVEIVARVCRKWTDQHYEVLDRGAAKEAEIVIKGGMQLFPSDATMIITYVNLLIDVLESTQTGYSQLQTAKKCNPNLVERFAIFAREQEHMQRASGAKSGESSVDLVSYVEYQRNHRLVLRAHRAALVAIRHFWQLLLHNTVAFTALAKALHRIEKSVSVAESIYRAALVRYPASPKLLRGYGKFLETVKNNPWKAAKYFGEAEKLQDMQQQDEATLAVMGSDEGGMGGNGAHLLHRVDERVNVVFLINSAGIIQLANKNACSLLGYGKGELDGKNINVIMPPPFSQRHNRYIRQYVQTGRERVISSVNAVVALHKARYVLPVKLGVSKVSGATEDSIFMGVLEPVPIDPSEAHLYLMPSGVVTAMDQAFAEWMGFEMTDILGKDLTSLVMDPEAILCILPKFDPMEQARQKAAKDAAAAAAQSASQGKFGGMGLGKPTPALLSRSSGSFSQTTSEHLTSVSFLHKYTRPVDCSVTVQRLGVGPVECIVELTLRRNGPAHLLALTGPSGRVRYIASELARALGTSPSALHRQPLGDIMPQPWGTLHAAWIKGMSTGGMSTVAGGPGAPIVPGSCRSGITTVLGSSLRMQGYYRLAISSSEESGGDVRHVMEASPSTREAALSERRLVLTVDADGIITEADDGPSWLYGFAPAQLLGRSLADVVTTLRPSAKGGENGEEGSGGEGGSSGGAGSSASVTGLLSLLISKAMMQTGTSWRVGVTVPTDEAELRALGPMRHAIMSKRTTAAIMEIEVSLDTTAIGECCEGASPPIPPQHAGPADDLDALCTAQAIGGAGGGAGAAGSAIHRSSLSGITTSSSFGTNFIAARHSVNGRGPGPDSSGASGGAAAGGMAYSDRRRGRLSSCSRPQSPNVAQGGSGSGRLFTTLDTQSTVGPGSSPPLATRTSQSLRRSSVSRARRKSWIAVENPRGGIMVVSSAAMDMAAAASGGARPSIRSLAAGTSVSSVQSAGSNRQQGPGAPGATSGGDPAVGTPRGEAGGGGSGGGGGRASTTLSEGAGDVAPSLRGMLAPGAVPEDYKDDPLVWHLMPSQARSRAGSAHSRNSGGDTAAANGDSQQGQGPGPEPDVTMDWRPASRASTPSLRPSSPAAAVRLGPASPVAEAGESPAGRARDSSGSGSCGGGATQRRSSHASGISLPPPPPPLTAIPSEYEEEVEVLPGEPVGDTGDGEATATAPTAESASLRAPAPAPSVAAAAAEAPVGSASHPHAAADTRARSTRRQSLSRRPGGAAGGGAPAVPISASLSRGSTSPGPGPGPAGTGAFLLHKLLSVRVSHTAANGPLDASRASAAQEDLLGPLLPLLVGGVRLGGSLEGVPEAPNEGNDAEAVEAAGAGRGSGGGKGGASAAAGKGGAAARHEGEDELYDDEGDDDDGYGSVELADDARAVKIRVSLWRADLMTPVVEVDSMGAITAMVGDDLAPPGLLFGQPTASMMGLPLHSFLNLQDRSVAGLFHDPGIAKRGGLKTTAKEANKVGTLREVTGIHVDGQPLDLTLQAVVKESAPSRTYVVLKPRKPSRGGHAALLHTVRDLGQGLAEVLDLTPPQPLLQPQSHLTLQGQPGTLVRSDTDVSATAAARAAGGPGAVVRLEAALRTSCDSAVSARGPAGSRAPAVLPPMMDNGADADVLITFEQGVGRPEAAGGHQTHQMAPSVSLPAAPAAAASQGTAYPNVWSIASPAVATDAGSLGNGELLSPYSPYSPAAVASSPDMAYLTPILPYRDSIGGGVGPKTGSESSGGSAPGGPNGSGSGSDSDSIGGNAKALGGSLGSPGSGARACGGRSPTRSPKGPPVRQLSPSKFWRDGDETALAAPAHPRQVLGPDMPMSAGGGVGEGGSEVEDNASEVSGGSAVSEVLDGSGPTADYRRGKRYRKLLKVLESPGVQRAARNFQWQALLANVAQLVSNLLAFILLTVLLQQQSQNVNKLYDATSVNRVMHESFLMMQKLNNHHEGIYPANGAYTTDSVPDLASKLKRSIGVFADLVTRTYEGVGTERQDKSLSYDPENAQEIWNKAIRNETLFYTTVPYRVEFRRSSLWDMSSSFIERASEVQHMHDTWGAKHGTLTTFDAYRWVFTNGLGPLFEGYSDALIQLTHEAIGQANEVNLLQLVLLVMQGCVVCVLLLLYMWWLQRRVSQQRYNLYSLFMLVPVGLLRALASKSVNVTDNSDAEASSDEDNGDQYPTGSGGRDGSGVPGGGGEAGNPRSSPGYNLVMKNSPGNGGEKTKGAGSLGNLWAWVRTGGASSRLASARADGGPVSSGGSGSQQHHHTHANKRRHLVPSNHDSVSLLAPFVVWGVLICVLYAVGFIMLRSTTGPLALLSAHNIAVVRLHRLTLYSLQLGSQRDTVSRLMLQPILEHELRAFQMEWDVLLYGANATTREDRRFTMCTINTAFSDKTLSSNAFRLEGCLGEACIESNDRFYAATTHGVSMMVDRFIEDVSYLVRQPPDLLTINNSHLDYILRSGEANIEVGIDTVATSLILSIRRLYRQVGLLQIFSLVLSWILAIAFIFVQLRPFIKANRVETQRIARMLSELPPELDIESIVARVLLREGGPASGSSGGAGGGGGVPGGMGAHVGAGPQSAARKVM